MYVNWNRHFLIRPGRGQELLLHQRNSVGEAVGFPTQNAGP